MAQNFPYIQQAQAAADRLQNKIIPLYHHLLTLQPNTSTYLYYQHQITKHLQNLNYITTLINNPHQPL